MKKIYYLLAFIAVSAVVTACNPLDKTYKQIGDLPTPTVPAQTITLSASDYALLAKGHAARTALYFKAVDTAKVDIPLILASKFPSYPNKTSVTVNYDSAPLKIKPIDTVFANVAYTLLPADYTLNGGTTTFTNFSATQIITWLGIKYPTATEGKLAVITFNFFEQGATTTGVQQSFLYTNGAWTKLYHITPAQYTSVGKGGNNNDFVTADAPLLPTYFNAFLKADPLVSISAKAGDIKYVSFKYFQAATGSGTSAVPAVTSQRIIVLTFDGTNWTTKSTAGTIIFAKTNGVWVADNTVTYKLTAADYTFIKGTSVNIQSARDNVAQFGDFNISTPLSATTGWSESDINAVLILIMTKDFPNAVADQKFIITYVAYNGATINVTKTFIYNGTTFVLQKS